MPTGVAAVVDIAWLSPFPRAHRPRGGGPLGFWQETEIGWVSLRPVVAYRPGGRAVKDRRRPPVVPARDRCATPAPWHNASARNRSVALSSTCVIRPLCHRFRRW